MNVPLDTLRPVEAAAAVYLETLFGRSRCSLRCWISAPPFLRGRTGRRKKACRKTSPYVNRISLLWQKMRGPVIERFPRAPGVPRAAMALR